MRTFLKMLQFIGDKWQIIVHFCQQITEDFKLVHNRHWVVLQIGYGNDTTYLKSSFLGLFFLFNEDL